MELPDFDDSAWLAGIEVDNNVDPKKYGWFPRPEIHEGAVWISSKAADIPKGNTSYCRLKLGKLIFLHNVGLLNTLAYTYIGHSNYHPTI